MNRRRIAFIAFCSLLLTTVAAFAARLVIANLQHFPDATGAVATYNTAGDLDRHNAFFQSLGTNGRTCETCHQADQAMSLSAQGVRLTYLRTLGKDPLFASVDGANCPTDRGRDPRKHSLLLERGLIRVGITLPKAPQFSLSVVHDPYGCAETWDANGNRIISVYRRPLPTTNLRYLSTVMFDGRETVAPLGSPASFAQNLNTDLLAQALSAVQVHAQSAADPTPAQLAEIVKFEMGLSTAQVIDNRAGPLDRHGAQGGPSMLAGQSYYPGMNDSLGADPEGDAFKSSAMTLYSAWERQEERYNGRDEGDDRYWGRGGRRAQERADIAAGQKLFNTAVATITDVRGLNDNPTLGSPAVIQGTCTTCHDSPNVGNHSLPLPLDIATSRQERFENNPSIIAALKELSAPDLPVFEITGCPDPQHPGAKLTFYTSDPGKGLVTGACGDVNRGKGPILRGLAARAPYFHNGAAANLDQLVEFYNQRFRMNFTAKQKRQLIAFLNSL